jgi:hypothetical protein
MATDLVDANVWTTPITVPEDGDDYDAASVELPFQALANRTVSLSSKIDAVPDVAHTWTEPQVFEDMLGLAGDSEVSYQPLARVRTIILPQTLACPRFGGAIKLLGGGVASPFGWTWEAAGAELIYMFRLPHAAILQRVRAVITGAGGTAATIHCYQHEALVDALIAGSTVHDLGETTMTVATGDRITHTVPAPLATNGAWHTYAIDVTLQAVGAVCAYVEIQFLDPGPRNF